MMRHRFDERRTESRTTGNYEFDFLTPDGQLRTMEFSATGLYDDSGSDKKGGFIGTYGVLRDVTESRMNA